MPAIQVACVDDNLDVLATLNLLFTRADGIQCAGCFPSIADFALANLQQSIDVLILDFTIPGEDTMQLLRQMKDAGDTFACIVLSGYDDAATQDAAFDAGAHRCISKDCDPETLTTAIREAHTQSPRAA